MVIAYKKIKKTDKRTYLKDENRALFNLGILKVLTYSIDHRIDSHFDEETTEIENSVGDIKDLVKDLDEAIFTDLYTNRFEKFEIEKSLEFQSAVLVQGLVGSGKSMILRKIDKEYKDANKKFVYIDMYFLPTEIVYAEGINFINEFQKYLYDILDREIIRPNRLSREWDIFALEHDKLFVELRTLIYSLTEINPTTPEEWEKVYENKSIRREFNKIKGLRETTTLLSFIKYKFNEIVICFDNLDRLPLEPQRQMILFSDNESKKVNVAMIIAIRESNLALLKAEAVEGRGGHDQLYNLQLVNYLEALETGRGKKFNCDKVDEASVRSILEARLDYIKKHASWNVFNGFLQSYIDKYRSENQLLPRTYEEFYINFWDIYEIITDTFVERDVYKLCNHSIREMLKYYFKFISILLMTGEDVNNFDRIFNLEEKTVKITLLRNLFLRYTLSNDLSIPTEDKILPNIFKNLDDSLCMLDYKILVYIKNYYQRNKNRLLYEKLREDFKRFSVSEKILKQRILYLCKPNGYEEMGFIILDGKKEAIITDNTPIHLQPAGEYFISTGITTREYIFWNSLFTELPIDLLPETHSLTEEETNDDYLKLMVVFRFFDYHYNVIRKELEQHHENLAVPLDYPDAISYYYMLFGYEREFIEIKMLESVKNTIEFSYFKQFSSRYALLREYNHLIDKYKDLFRTYLKIY